MRAPSTTALLLACSLLVACDRSPSAPSTNQGLPQSDDGRRTSVPGKAMDRAEDLKKEVDAYNRTIEDTIAQGANDAPPSRNPAPKPRQTPPPKYRPAEPPGGAPVTP